MSSHSLRDKVVEKFLELDDHRCSLPSKEEHREFFDGMEASSILVRGQVIENQSSILTQLEILFKDTYTIDCEIEQLESKLSDIEEDFQQPLTTCTRSKLDHQKLLLIMEIEALRLRVQSICGYVTSRLEDLINEVPRNTIVETLRVQREKKKIDDMKKARFVDEPSERHQNILSEIDDETLEEEEDNPEIGNGQQEGLSNWNVAARNFAVALVQRLESSMKTLQGCYSKPLSLYGFVMMISDFIEKQTELALQSARQVGTHSLTGGFQQVFGIIKSSKIYQNASSPQFLESREGDSLREEIKRWEGCMRYKWESISAGDDKVVVDFFASRVSTEFSLWHLFKAIDHNKTSFVTWDNFLAYLFDSTMKGRAGVTSKDDIRLYTLAHRDVTPAFHKVNYFRHIPKIGSLLVHSRDKESHVIKLLDDVTFRTQKEYVVAEEHGYLTASEVILDFDILIICTADTFIRAYDLKTYTLRMKRKNGSSTTCVKWNSQTNRLYVGLRTGELQVWNISMLEKTNFFVPNEALAVKAPEPIIDIVVKQHSDAITDMLFLPFDGNLVTSSLDTTINCLNLRTMQLVKTLRGHKRGVCHLSYSQQYNLFVSAGHEYTPLAWVINVPNSKPFLLRDGAKPHCSPIVGIIQIPCTPQCASLDVSGMLKIWDVRTLLCVQTIFCEPNASKEELRTLKWRGFIYHPGTKQIITAAKRRAYVFQYNLQGKSIDPKSAMDFGISTAIYNEKLSSFITCSRKDVKVWDHRSGRIMLSLDDVAKEDIRVVVVDDEGRKCYLGCYDGAVVSVSMSSCAAISKVQLPSNCEILSMISIPRTPYLLSITSDGVLTVVIDDDDSGDLNSTSFTLTGGRSSRIDAKVLTLYQEMNIFMIGEGQNVVSVWQAQPISTGISLQWRKHSGCTSSPLTSEITCVIPLKPFPCFAAADCSGGLHTWTLSGSDVRTPYTCMSRWVNNHPHSGSRYTPTVVAMAFYPDLALLYTADDLGIINIFSIKAGLDSNLISRQTDDCETSSVLSNYQDPFASSQSQAYPVQRIRKTGGPRRAPELRSSITTARYLHSWKGHNDGITALQLIDNPWCIMSAGGDCQVTIRSLWGEKIAYLAKAQLPGYFTLDMRCKDRQKHNDIPHPHNPAAARTLRESRRFSRHQSLAASRGTSLGCVLAASPPQATTQKKSVASLVTFETSESKADSAEPEEDQLATSDEYDFSKLLQHYTVFYRSSSQIAKMQKSGTELSALMSGSLIQQVIQSNNTNGKNKNSSEKTTASNNISSHAKQKYETFVSPLLIKAPPVASQGELVSTREQQDESNSITVANGGNQIPEVLYDPNLSLKYGTPGDTVESIIKGDNNIWTHFANRSHKRAVTTERGILAALKATESQQKPSRLVPIELSAQSNTPSHQQQQGRHLRTRRSSDERSLPTLLRGSNYAMSSKRSNARRSPTPESDHSFTAPLIGWNTVGDGVAMRKLSGKPYVKSWLLT